MTEKPEVTSETESARTWRKIRRHAFSALARLAVYGSVLLMAGSEIIRASG